MFSKKVVSNLGRSSVVRAMFENGTRMKKIYGEDKVYDFSIGNPDAATPEKINEVLTELANTTEKGIHSYMPNAGYPETRQAIANKLSKDHNMEIPASCICMTCGAAGALNIALKSILNPDEEVIVFAPYFVEYLFYIENYSGVAKIVETDDSFNISLDELEKAITPKTKAIIINTPNNPSGVVYDEDTLKKMNALIEKKQEEFNSTIFVLSDEPYVSISYDCEVPSVFQIFTNAIIVNSFSKSLSLPGERIGFVACSPKIKDIATLMDAVIFCNRTLGFVNAPAIAQRIITKCVDEKVDVEGYKEKRDILYDIVTNTGFECILPSGAFYLFVKSPIADDGEFCNVAMEKYQIIAAPGKGFGRTGYFRLSYCISKDTIINSREAFEKLAQEYKLK